MALNPTRLSVSLDKINQFASFLISLLSLFKSAFGLKEAFFLGGLSMLFYGLWLLQPWIAFTVIGVILMMTGYLMRDK